MTVKFIYLMAKKLQGILAAVEVFRVLKKRNAVIAIPFNTIWSI